MDPGIFFIGGGGRGVQTLVQKRLLNLFVENYPGVGGKGGTPLQETKRDVPLDGVALSRLE